MSSLYTAIPQDTSTDESLHLSLYTKYHKCNNLLFINLFFFYVQYQVSKTFDITHQSNQ